MINQYASQESRKLLARQIAEESTVLLKNENGCLPLGKGTAAFFGRTILEPVIGGSGSGASEAGVEPLTFPEACKREGVTPVAELVEYYQVLLGTSQKTDALEEFRKKVPELVASGMIYEFFGRYQSQPGEPEIPSTLVAQAAEKTDRAVIVIGRMTGGEECDRRIADDYELLESERVLIDTVCASFSKVVLILNINGAMDLSWIASYPCIQAVLYVGTPGEQGTAAAARILSGAVSPSGKLAFTLARAYADYPAAEDFSFNKDLPDTIKEYQDYGLDAAANGSVGFEKSPVTVYREGIYTGYRYFDSFGKDVLYPFGYGLSYAQFETGKAAVTVGDGRVTVRVPVKNSSAEYTGKETVQVYVSKPQDVIENPYQVYMGCAKTSCLAPGECETAEVSFALADLACYDEASAAWVLPAGEYVIRAGVSSRETHVAACLEITERIVCEQTKNALGLLAANEGKIDFLSAKDAAPVSCEGETAEREAAMRIVVAEPDVVRWTKQKSCCANAQEAAENGGMETRGPASGACGAAGEQTSDGQEGAVSAQTDMRAAYTLADVKAKNVTMEQFLAQMTIEELAVLANGYGPGLPFAALSGGGEPTIRYEDGTDIGSCTHPTGNVGYVSPALAKYGIPSAFYKDGPASVGMTAWPTGMTLACCFNTDLFYAFGSACGYEAQLQDVDSWLAPGLNLMRSPIGGRNFEYFSEDPYAAGICGIYICKGAAETTTATPCPKHFAVNEQETYRRGSERFRFDAVDSVLSERTAREIYLKPFEMVIRNTPVRTVMTSFNKINGTFAGGSHDLCTKILRDEWGFHGVVVTDWGDMDIVVDGADAVAAGNDVVMPGGPPVIAQVLKGYEEGRVNREQLEAAAAHLLYFVMHSAQMKG